MNKPMQITPRDVVRALGGPNRVAAELGVTAQAVTNAQRRGWFPAAWYTTVKRLATDAGAECPNALFAMRGQK